MADLTVNIDFRTRGGVAILTLAHSPVNAISRDLRANISKALDQAARDPQIFSVVLTGRGAHFSVGADVTEFGASAYATAAPNTSTASLTLAALCRQIEAMEKPVIAAMHGSAIGDGLELCLACHYRMADETTRMAYPEVTFGMLPAGGGTQRLPRLVGAQHALRLLLDAQPVAADTAHHIGLIDEISPIGTSVLERAVARAQAGVALRRTMSCRDGLRDAKAYFAVVAAERARAFGLRNVVWTRIVDCVEAAILLSPEQGMGFERSAAQDLSSGDASKALRHAFFCERRATRPPATALTAQQAPVANIAIWGASNFAVDIAFQALAAGMTVVLIDPRREASAKCLTELTNRQTAAVKEGRMSTQAQQADWLRLKSSQSPEDLRGKDIVFASTDAPPLPIAVSAARTIFQGGLRTNTDQTAVAMTAAPAIGLVCEITLAPQASATTRNLAHAFARKMNWKTVEVGPGGPIESRLRQNLTDVIGFLGQSGVSRDAISQSLLGFGIGAAMRSRASQMPPKGDWIIQIVCAGMANEGFRLLGEGIAKHPQDIDAVSVLTGFFPRWQGGPMFWAQRTGLLVLQAQLQTFAASGSDVFTPAPLLGQMISQNITLAMLNKA